MKEDLDVLCAASSYDKKFYLNEDFGALPDSIKDELKIMCVLLLRISEELSSLNLMRKAIF